MKRGNNIYPNIICQNIKALRTAFIYCQKSSALQSLSLWSCCNTNSRHNTGTSIFLSHQYVCSYIPFPQYQTCKWKKLCLCWACLLGLVQNRNQNYIIWSLKDILLTIIFKARSAQIGLLSELSSQVLVSPGMDIS